MTNEDLRQFPRIGKNALVSYERVDAGQVADSGMARTLDISLKGVALELTREVAVGNRLRLDLSIGGDIVAVMAEVVRVTPRDDVFEVGAVLLEIPEAYLERIEDLLDH